METQREMLSSCFTIKKKEDLNQKMLTYIFWEITSHMTIYFSFSYLNEYPGFNRPL
jgi:hypothetical protein